MLHSNVFMMLLLLLWTELQHFWQMIAMCARLHC